MKRLAVVLVLIAAVGLGSSRAYDWWNFNVYTPVAGSNTPVPFRIDPGELPSAVGDDLATQHLIRDRDVFAWYLRFTGAGSKFEAGSFILNRNMNMAQIADALQHGKANQTPVTIPEGFPLKFQATYVEKSGIAKADDYLTVAADPSWAGMYDFLGTRPSGADPPLEGYLFPDTYLVDSNAGARCLIKAQLDRFGSVFTPDLRAQIAQPTATRPAETVESIVILASLVEREANADSDRGNVCSVYYNRLKVGIPLGVDATLLYALGRLTPEPTAAELQLNSPFNTRTHAGIPPGPISNPGKAALLACINPPQTSYLFYFADRKGVTHFENNQQDFERDIQIYGLSGS
jgi:UPF0755 protein